MIRVKTVCGVATRLEDAERWYRRAADGGDTGAMYNLGLLLRTSGRLDDAERWYRRAADASY